MNKIKQKYNITILLTVLLILFISQICFAKENLADEEDVVKEVLMEKVCVDEKAKCLDKKSNKTRIVNKIAVTQDCWKYEYVKSCNKVPSKNDCGDIPIETFNLSKENCLVTGKLGEKSFCLNMKKTFSHTYMEKETIDQSELIMDPDNKEVTKNLLCEAFCLDGKCSSAYKANQDSNDEMASSIAQLDMLSKIKKGLVDDKNLKFDVFRADVKRCHNKTKIHSNCCNDSGLFKSAGLVKCSPEAKALASEGRKGRCEYIGEYCAKETPLGCIRTTKSYCCFPTVLAKVIHRGARIQLGKNLGSAKRPQCGGLNLAEIEKIDFTKIDFKEFYELELKQMMKGYSSEDNEALIKRSFPNGTNKSSRQTRANANAFPNTNKNGISEQKFSNAD